MYRTSAENKKQLFVPKGFAHGFIVLSEYADFQYKTTDYYYPEYERVLLWNCKKLNIKWPVADPILIKEIKTVYPLIHVKYLNENFSYRFKWTIRKNIPV